MRGGQSRGATQQVGVIEGRGPRLLHVMAEPLHEARRVAGSLHTPLVGLDAGERLRAEADAEAARVAADLVDEPFGVGDAESPSSTPAVSRIVRVIAPSVSIVTAASPGRLGSTRPRDGLSPTTPHCEAGMRMDPAMSFACATGTNPAATAAPDPPDDPPGERSRFQGLCVGP